MMFTNPFSTDRRYFDSLDSDLTEFHSFFLIQKAIEDPKTLKLAMSVGFEATMFCLPTDLIFVYIIDLLWQPWLKNR
jgi:hypothetical protein